MNKELKRFIDAVISEGDVIKFPGNDEITAPTEEEEAEKFSYALTRARKVGFLDVSSRFYDDLLQEGYDEDEAIEAMIFIMKKWIGI